MRHRPHLYLPAPWNADGTLPVPDAVRRHCERVLHIGAGDLVDYTDGNGVVGTGTWRSDGVARGDERSIGRPEPRLTLVVAPPKAKDRQRFVVEKLQELAVDELVWVRTARCDGRPPSHERAASWATSALEQSRGAHLLHIRTGDVTELDGAFAADAAASESLIRVTAKTVAVVIGPEGGLTEEEVARCVGTVTLGPTILRTETASITAAALVRLA